MYHVGGNSEICILRRSVQSNYYNNIGFLHTKVYVIINLINNWHAKSLNLSVYFMGLYK